MVSRPEMGGATAHPTGATLALGDPSVSLNALGVGGGLERHHRLEAIQVLDLMVGAELVLGQFAGASVVTRIEQDSGIQNGLPRPRGSILLAVCPVACLGV